MRAESVLAAAAALVLLPALPAAAASDRMQLHCADGRVLERTNGSSWWGETEGAGYVSQHLTITDDQGQLVHEQAYGRKANAERSTCVAEHFDWTWTVELVRTR